MEQDCKPTETGRRTERNFAGALWVSYDCQPLHNDIYYYKLQTIDYCVRHRNLSSSLFPYASIWISMLFSLCFSPPKNFTLLKVSNKAMPWWSRWEACRNKADLASAWAAALYFVPNEKLALESWIVKLLIAHKVFFWTHPSPSKLSEILLFGVLSQKLTLAA